MLIKDLTQAFGVSGHEKKVSDIIIDNIKSYVDEITVDALGNVIALKRGNGIDKKKIMISAHMDEIGFAVMSITEKGFIKVRPLGGVSIFTSFSNKLRFKNGTIGAILSDGDISEIKNNDVGRLYVDIGANSKEEALKYVSIGETAAYVSEYYELPNNRIMTKALDDRIGCYIAIETLKKVNNVYNDIYCVFSVQEEVGIRGAKVAANRIKPDIGVAVDITGSFDVPGTGDQGNVVLGKGAAIKLMDASVICDEYLISVAIDTAKEGNIAYQMEVLAAGGTDANAINQSNDGVRAIGISIPTRYGHGPVSMVDLFDVNCCIDLLAGYVNKKFIF